jgi:hypothetical protein
MTNMDRAKRAEIDSNLARFLELLPEMLQEHPNEHVLMRHGTVLDYFESALDAQIAGNQRFQDQLFSIQRIQEVAEELGHYAHALHQR